MIWQEKAIKMVAGICYNNEEWAHLLEDLIIDKTSLALESIFTRQYSYNISSKIDGPKISMANRFSQGGFAISSYTPGPGNYNTTNEIARPGSGATMGAKYSSSRLLN